MSYSAIEKEKKFISDQPYLYYYTGTPDNVIEHYAYLKLEVCVVFNDIVRCSRVVIKVWLV